MDSSIANDIKGAEGIHTVMTDKSRVQKVTYSVPGNAPQNDRVLRLRACSSRYYATVIMSEIDVTYTFSLTHRGNCLVMISMRKSPKDSHNTRGRVHGSHSIAGGACKDAISSVQAWGSLQG